MFVKAIERASAFTRPIHSFIRNYESDAPYAAAATLFVINSDGWALTCKHVAQDLMREGAINNQYDQYRKELLAGKGHVKDKQLRKQLAAKYGYGPKIAIELSNNFINCVDGAGVTLRAEFHPDIDLALIRFLGFKTLSVTTFPVFARDGKDLLQGKTLCRLGYPFPEFTNFAYDPLADRTSWTTIGRDSSPSFPLDGMVTRLVGQSASQVTGFELSTPGLRGQSGGPVFDTDGRVWGMQCATAHLDLNFDRDVEVLREGEKTKRRVNAFLHVGHAVHVDVLKSFMRQHGVQFQEG